jgi:hypothetical protein
MSDARLKTIRVFVVQNLQVPLILEWASDRSERLPAKLILDDVRLNGADRLLDFVNVNAILAKRAGKSSEVTNALVFCAAVLDSTVGRELSLVRTDVVLCFSPGNWLVFGVPHGHVDDIVV